MEPKPIKRSVSTTGGEDVHAKSNSKRSRCAKSNETTRFPIPSLDVTSADFSPEQLWETYEKFQVIHLRGLYQRPKNNDDDDKSFLSWKDLHSLFHSLDSKDQESWCIENPGKDESSGKKGGTSTGAAAKEDLLSPERFLSPKPLDFRPAYCSFLVQHDQRWYEEMLSILPVQSLPPMCTSSTAKTATQSLSYEPCLWMFFGRNPAAVSDASLSPLQGRPLHTDSVSHDGTWHFQLSGIKEWQLAPSPKMFEYWQQPQYAAEMKDLVVPWENDNDDDDVESGCNSDGAGQKLVSVICQETDVIVVNTRFWFHRTVIPTQKVPSVSYARDFRIHAESTLPNQGDECATASTSNAMTNVDGLYATRDIDAGTILFTESDMPDCELHRSNDNPNCKVVELEDGTGAVVSRRPIASGEFFCVAETDDEDEEEEELNEEEIEEEEWDESHDSS